MVLVACVAACCSAAPGDLPTAVTAATPAVTTAPVYRDRAAPISARVADLVARMTTQEKINQLLSLWTESNGNNYDYITQTYGATGVGAAYGFWLANAHDNRSRWEAQNDLQTYMVTHSRLGIPIDIIEETLHGGSAYPCTSCIEAASYPCHGCFLPPEQWTMVPSFRCRAAWARRGTRHLSAQLAG